ncbi:hypothetical protein ID866_10324 [Astraeus odoratus]|nr:hypothetical protein ID866_10324 [Astraeus odoratus]
MMGQGGLIQSTAKAQVECTTEDWELVLEASLDLNLDDDKATNDLQKKAKEDCMNKRAAERRWKHEEEEEQRIWAEAEQKVWEEAEWLARQEAKWKEEEEKAQRAEEAKWRAEEAEKAAEVQRRTVERQHKLSVVIPVGGSLCRSASGPSSGARAPCDRCMSQRPPLRCEPGMAKGKLTTCEPYHKAKASCSWSKAARGAIQKWRRMQSKEDDRDDEDDEDNEVEGEGNFVVLQALVQEHRDMLGALMMTLSTLLKEFKGYHHEQWDLQAHQVRGLKALQKEMKKANALKAKELEATTKGKEKAVEVSEESSESGEEEEEVKDGNKGGVAEGEGDNRDGDMEMGMAPSASAM